jgi:hypothetical protein
MNWGKLRYGVKHDSSQDAKRRAAEPKDLVLFAYRLGHMGICTHVVICSTNVVERKVDVD